MCHEVIDSAQPHLAEGFNEYVASATGLAVYGCGILASAHVGALRSLERHGLQVKQLKTLAGVSAGAVVVACLAVGYDAQELFTLVEALPFHTLAIPEAGALLRATGNMLITILQFLFGRDATGARIAQLSRGNGPGLNSGAALEKMIGEALARKCGDGNITLRQVRERFGTRLVILVAELDTGRERQLTPEDDPDLPLRCAVRMSMGIPGVVEPFRYDGHVYCDGGMCNDFPLNVLPNDGHRLGLMVRPKEWVGFSLGDLTQVVGGETLASAPAAHSALESIQSTLRHKGIYPVRDCVDLMMTSMNVMMDANLALQIGNARSSLARRPGVSASRESIFELVPEVLTLSGGGLSPFDFGLSKEQHRDLYLGGQLAVHLHAAQYTSQTRLIATAAAASAADEEPALDARGEAVMSRVDRLKALLYLLHIDYPSRQTVKAGQ